MGGGIDLHVRPYHDIGADADRRVVQQGGPHVDVAALAKVDVAAIGAVEGRADKGVFCQFTNQLRQQCPLFSLIFRPIQTAIAARRLPAQNIQLRGHAVVGLAG
ncbi:hypothetical protein D3C86_1648740 [compost metagenome]